MKTVPVVMLVGFTLATAAVGAEPELKGSAADLATYLSSVPGQIRIAASAEVKVEANRALMRLRVNNKDKLFERALAKNRKAREEIVQLLTERGLSKDGIRVSKFSTIPSYGFFSKKPEAYEITSSVEIHAANENEVQAVAALVDSKPEVGLESLRFEYTDEDTMKRKALQEALDKVTAQKKLYEEKLGVTLRARGVVLPSVPERRRAAVAGLSTGGESLSLAETLSDEQFQVRIRSLAQRGVDPDISQFDQVMYQAQVTIVFDVIAGH